MDFARSANEENSILVKENSELRKQNAALNQRLKEDPEKNSLRKNHLQILTDIKKCSREQTKFFMEEIVALLGKRLKLPDNQEDQTSAGVLEEKNGQTH